MTKLDELKKRKKDLEQEIKSLEEEIELEEINEEEKEFAKVLDNKENLKMLKKMKNYFKLEVELDKFVNKLSEKCDKFEKCKDDCYWENHPCPLSPICYWYIEQDSNAEYECENIDEILKKHNKK